MPTTGLPIKRTSSSRRSSVSGAVLRDRTNEHPEQETPASNISMKRTRKSLIPPREMASSRNAVDMKKKVLAKEQAAKIDTLEKEAHASNKLMEELRASMEEMQVSMMKEKEAMQKKYEQQVKENQDIKSERMALEKELRRRGDAIADADTRWEALRMDPVSGGALVEAAEAEAARRRGVRDAAIERIKEARRRVAVERARTNQFVSEMRLFIERLGGTYSEPTDGGAGLPLSVEEEAGLMLAMDARPLPSTSEMWANVHRLSTACSALAAKADPPIAMSGGLPPMGISAAAPISSAAAVAEVEDEGKEAGDESSSGVVPPRPVAAAGDAAAAVSATGVEGGEKE